MDTRFTNASGAENKVSDRWNQVPGANGNAGLNAIAEEATYDAAIRDTEFVQVGDTLEKRLVFASGEYIERVSSGYHDAVGIWLNGVKVELAPGDGDSSVDNINAS